MSSPAEPEPDPELGRVPELDADPELGADPEPGAGSERGSAQDAERARGAREHWLDQPAPRVNPARFEVRVRRIALLALVLVPIIYFVVQALR